MAIEIRRLRPDDDRSDFRSGNIDLDRFFQRYAGQNQFRHHIGTTYVAIEGETILGIATIAPSELTSAALPAGRRRRLPQYPLPVLRLARLATHERARGRGVGGALLRAVFSLAKDLAANYGCVGVVVDAKPDAVPFYEKLGFHPLPAQAGHLGDRPEPTALFIEIGAIASPAQREAFRGV
jgi:GNAT superfamily N-acetyltransferase